MKYFVIITFDLNGAEPSVYRTIYKEFESIRSKYLHWENKNNYPKLISNFINIEVDYHKNKYNLSDYFEDKIIKIFEKLSLKGLFFISVSLIDYSCHKFCEFNYSKLDNLEDIYHNGKEVVQNDLKTDEYCGNGSQQGLVETQFNQTSEWYEKASRAVEAQFNQTAEWYEKAGQQGAVEAQFNLGVMYYYGKGVVQDYQQAIHWFEKAAEQGIVEAQFNLGQIYQNTLHDYKKAEEWYAKASRQADDWYEKARQQNDKRAMSIELAPVPCINLNIEKNREAEFRQTTIYYSKLVFVDEKGKAQPSPLPQIKKNRGLRPPPRASALQRKMRNARQSKNR